MTEDKDFKKLVRARAERTGESYSTARRQLRPMTAPEWSLSPTAPPGFVHERDGSIHVLRSAGAGDARTWSYLARTVDVRALAGEALRVRGQVLASDVRGEAWLNIRTDDVLGRPVTFEPHQLALGSATWQDVTSLIEVSPLAVTLRSYAVLAGSGRLAVKAFEVSPAGGHPPWPVRTQQAWRVEPWDDPSRALEDSVRVQVGGSESQLVARVVHHRVDELVDAVTASRDGVLTMERVSMLADLLMATREAAGTWHLSVVTADVTRQGAGLRRDQLIGLLRTWLAGQPLRATESWEAS